MQKILLALLAFLVCSTRIEAAKVKGVADIEVPYESFKKCDHYKINRENEVTFIYRGPNAKEETYTKIPIFPNGKMIIPKVGEIAVEGKSVEEVKEVVQTKLGEEYNIEIFVYRIPNNISVLGEVKNPGSYHHNDIRTVYDAIAKAGGFTVTAMKTEVTLIRQRVDGTRVSYIINFPKEVFDAYEPGTGLGEDIYTLKEGDLIFVPTSRLKQLGQYALKALNLATLGILTGVFTGIISNSLN